jgi:hypothetical protein
MELIVGLELILGVGGVVIFLLFIWCCRIQILINENRSIDKVLEEFEFNFTTKTISANKITYRGNPVGGSGMEIPTNTYFSNYDSIPLNILIDLILKHLKLRIVKVSSEPYELKSETGNRRFPDEAMKDQ